MLNQDAVNVRAPELPVFTETESELNPPKLPEQSGFSRSLRRIAHEFFVKERFLGPTENEKNLTLGNQCGVSSHPTMLLTPWQTIQGTFALLKKEMQSALWLKVGLTAGLTTLGVTWPWLSGKVVGSITEGQSAALSVVGALAAVGIFSLVKDLTGRAEGYFASWEQSKADRLSEKLQSQVTGSWSYEELEDGRRRLSTSRFRQSFESLFSLHNSAVDIASGLVGATVSAVALSTVDVRISIAALLFVGVRMARDLREARVAHRISWESAEQRRELSVKKELSSVPEKLRDIRQLGKNETLHQEYQHGAQSVDRRELINLKRTQIIRLIFDFAPAMIMVGAVSAMAQKFSAGTLHPESVVAFVGYAAGLADYCRSLSASVGEAMSSVTSAAEALTFLKSRKNSDPNAVDLPRHTAPPLITFQDVDIIRNDRAILHIPRLSIHPGEIIGIVGREGAGKSTLIKSIQRMREIDPAGSIKLSWGEQVYDLKTVRQESWDRLIGNLSQDFSPEPGMTVREVLNLGAGRSAPEREMSFEEATALTTVSEVLEQVPFGEDSQIGAGWPGRGVDFSGGQRKLMALAAILRSRAPLIILDEPVAHLSPQTGNEILSRICANARSYGQTVIIISHNFGNFSFADRILSIEDGKIVQDGTPDELRHQPGPYRDGIEQSLSDILRGSGYKIVQEDIDPPTPNADSFAQP